MNALKEIIDSIDLSNPDFSILPENFPDCDISGLTSGELGKFLAIKSLWELAKPKKPHSSTRVWTTPEGYRFLIQWTNLQLLRILVRKFTVTLPYKESRLKAQMDDAARSSVSNLEEGYKRPDTKQYLNFLGYSQASLEKVEAPINLCLRNQ